MVDEFDDIDETEDLGDIELPDDIELDDDLGEITEDSLDGDESDEIKVVEETSKKGPRQRSRRLKGVTKKKKKIKKGDREKLQPVLQGQLKNKPFTVVCSECYEEFTVNPNYKAETFNCPDCDHPAKGPDEEFLRKYYGSKKNEGFYLMMALISFAVVAIVTVVWQFLLVNPENERTDSITYGFWGLIVIAFICGVYFSIRYETRRYETYF